MKGYQQPARQDARVMGALLCMSVIGLILQGFSGAVAESGNKTRYYDIYLTDNRICEACTGQWVARDRVALTNRQGERAIVNVREILGVDNHPIARRLLKKSLHGTGLAAKVIVPYAFDDWEQFVCKYCEQFDPER